MHLMTRFLRTLLAIGFLASLGSVLGAVLARGRMTSRGGTADDELDLVAIFESLTFASTANALRRLRVTTWYGGGTLDLRGATLDPAGARMTLRALFGGLRVVVPETWRVAQRGTGIFGGIGDGRSAAGIDPEGPVLTLDGFAMFGGVGIVAQAPDLDVPYGRSVDPSGIQSTR